ncbi:putative SOS response-associated peptidase YedK [Mesorhizobium soli]|uniref:SOS response-associated peptidase n=1 Tax=Pseudaminobacter soli (ex Li et al. 2025) TaxID=1295366 RepID=UPI00247464AA|nr:SOS response-associated peptidase [Mesorhizobium soli]MDH6229993.1 putative SOS response-associated peptidase YedK [Mesorhizobium soli]
MCGRFSLTASPKEVDAAFSLPDLEAFPPRYNIAPTQPILMVVAGEPRERGSNLPDRHSLLVRWGLIPTWVKDTREFPLLINARSETATEKASFRTAMRHRRALIPASGFYEWRQVGGKRTQAYWIRPKHGGVIAFGSLMETYAEPGGSEMDTGAILTTKASRDIAHIHDRMPVVIHQQDFSRWLDCRFQEPRDVADLMRPVEPDFFEAVPVSDLVNKVANTDPRIQERVEPLEGLEPPKPERRKASPAAQHQMTLF